jgi:hypothetical protein
MKERVHVVRSMRQLSCEARRAWEKVCFYEHVAVQPTWLLRAALPVPVRTTGAYSQVGNTSRCLYSDGGFLAKRIRAIVAGERVDFEVIEQSIRYAGRIDLRGGSIRVLAHADGSCSVEMVTNYQLRARWLSLLRPAIDYVIGAMHRLVLRDMRERLEEVPSPRPLPA